MTKDYILIGIVSLFVLAAAIFGIVEVKSVPSPLDTNKDNIRSENLQNINQNIVSYYYQNRMLPATLDKLNIDTPYKDPVTNKPYDYSVLSDIDYTLCASFKTDTSKQSRTVYNSFQNFYEHPKGYYCFNLKIMQTMPPVPAPSPLQSNQTGADTTQIGSHSPNDISTPQKTQTGLSTTDEISYTTIAGTPYFVIVGNYIPADSKSFSVSGGGSITQITVQASTTYMDNNDHSITFNTISKGDIVRVLANTKKGGVYIANSVQDLSR